MLKIPPTHFLVVLLLGLFLATSVGCGLSPEEAEAERFLNNYFKYLKKQDFNTTHSMYDRSAFGVVSSAKTLRGMKKTMESFGPLQSYDFDAESFYVKDNKDGMLSLKFSYDVVYKNMKTREGFIVRKLNKGRWKIISHTIERL